MTTGRAHRPAVVAVVGGYGTAITFEVARVPAGGETLLAAAVSVDHGGKGSNQAVAARRLGARVALLSSVGPDAFGSAGHELWRDEGIDATHVRQAKLPTMLGAILLETGGENRIVVGMGALGELEVGDAEAFRDEIAGADVCVVSLEVPATVAAHVLTIAKQSGTLALLNPAPVVELPSTVVHAVDVIVPNRSEAERLTASAPGTAPDVLLDHLRGLCAGAIVLTLGAEGCIVDNGSSRQRVPAPAALKVVDTTGAGDAFIGALATGLARGLDLRAASEVAVTAASFSVGIGGVVPSLPHLSDLPEGLRERISGGTAKR